MTKSMMYLVGTLVLAVLAIGCASTPNPPISETLGAALEDAKEERAHHKMRAMSESPALQERLEEEIPFMLIGIDWIPGNWCDEDIDYSTIVGLSDLGQIGANWGKQIFGVEDINWRADVDKSTVIGAGDMSRVSFKWGRRCIRLWTGTTKWHEGAGCTDRLYLTNETGIIEPVSPAMCVETLLDGPFIFGCMGNPDWFWVPENVDSEEWVSPYEFCDDLLVEGPPASGP